MTPLLTINLLRALFVAFAACLGAMMGESILASATRWRGRGCGVWTGGGPRGSPAPRHHAARFLLRHFRPLSRLHLRAAAACLANPRTHAEDTQWLAGLIVYATFGYFGMMLAIRSNRDEFALIIPYVRFRRSNVQDMPLIVDSSVIIEGRLTQLCSTGFVSSSLIIPRFVLEELQRLADSGDPLKRERGRAALERLQQMQRDPALSDHHPRDLA